jgi:hypothetical protein
MLAPPIGGVDGLFRLAGSRNGPSTTWLKSAMPIYDNRSEPMVSLTPRSARNAPAAPIQMPPAIIEPSIMPTITTSGGAPRRAAALAAAATPPTTSAPSPPMIINPSRAGSAVQSPVNIKGAARSRLF